MKGEILEIPVACYRAIFFRVPADKSDQPVLSGRLAIFPDTSFVELILMHIDDYAGWTGLPGREAVDTISYARVSGEDFRMNAASLGDYVLVICNRTNYLPVTVRMDLDLLFRGPGSGDPLPSAVGMAMLVVLLGVSVATAIAIFLRYKG